jgi:hypothetical protein
MIFLINIKKSDAFNKKIAFWFNDLTMLNWQKNHILYRLLS